MSLNILLDDHTNSSTKALQINGIYSLLKNDVASAEQDANPQEDFARTLHMRSANTALWQGCHCATSLPQSRTSFRIWNIKFELEQQEHHLTSCKLWGTKRGMKRITRATFPIRLAWLSTRMTIACFEYASGTSRPGLTIRCRNIVHTEDSPVYKLLDSFVDGMEYRGITKQMVRKMELLERDILAVYANGQASPGDIDEHDRTHAEVKLQQAAIAHMANFLQMIFAMADTWGFGGYSGKNILLNNELMHTFMSCVRTLFQACNGTKEAL